MPVPQKVKDAAIAAIDKRTAALGEFSHEIWKKPELAYEEESAHKLITDFLEKEGFSVERQTPLKTSFIARSDSRDGPRVGVMCEYDALPGMGHACGHNLIAEAGVAAAIGIKTALQENPNLKGQVVILGTPAEEAGGGKVDMLEKGSFDELDFCMMVHPSPKDTEFEDPYILSAYEMDVHYTGRAAHASAAPWAGINALDAAVTCYNSVALLKKQTKQDTSIAAIITNGGDKANIIPSKASLRYDIRAPTSDETRNLINKVKLCAQGAAEATGCTVEFKPTGNFYSNLRTNKTLRKLYGDNLMALGYKSNPAPTGPNARAATDAGNVSYVKPTIQPFYAIGTDHPNHTPPFAGAAADPKAQIPTLQAGKAMALAAIEVLFDPKILQEIKEEFIKQQNPA